MRHALEDDVLHHRIHPHVNEKQAFSKIFTLESDFKRMQFWKAKPEEKISVFKQKRIRVDGAQYTTTVTVVKTSLEK